MKMKKFIICLFLLNSTLSGCSSLGEVGEVMRNEKSTGTDQYLIKKRAPLTQPPDFRVVPVPGKDNNIEKENNNELQKILKVKKKNTNNKNITTSTESSILKKIK
tara:strand:+ start:878 stop:1192 length:315 start_codon:yes stop_codon:yes gene_type:complete